MSTRDVSSFNTTTNELYSYRSFFILLSLIWTRTFYAKNGKNLSQIIAKNGHAVFYIGIKLLPKMAKIWVKLLPKTAILTQIFDIFGNNLIYFLYRGQLVQILLPKTAMFGQTVFYIGNKSNYCQKRQYLDKLSPI